MTLPPPPRVPMSHRAQTIRRRVFERVVALGRWEPIDALMLDPLAIMCEQYLSFRDQLREVPAEQIDAEFHATVRETHELARQMLADYLVIPERRLHLVPLDANGDDIEIVALAAGAPQDGAR
jgi:hypothetical protein